MSVVGEVVGTIACVAAIVSAYRDGGIIIDRIKRKRAAKRALPPPRLLEESAHLAPSAIEQEQHRGVARFGIAFEHGDHVAVIALQQITIQLQESLLHRLQTSAFDDEEVTNFTYLIDAADDGRDKTISTLLDLRQRLLQGAPITEVRPRETRRVQSPEAQTQAPGRAQSPVSRSKQTPPLSKELPVRPRPRALTSETNEPKEKSYSHNKTLSHDAANTSLTHQRTPSHRSSQSHVGADQGNASAGAEQQRGRRWRAKILDKLTPARSRSPSGRKIYYVDGKEWRPTKVKNGGVSFWGPPKYEPHKYETKPIPSDEDDSVSIRTVDTQELPDTTGFVYGEGEDNPFEIWGSKDPAKQRSGKRRISSSVGPDVQPGTSSLGSSPASSTSFMATAATGGPRRSTTGAASISVPQPNQENNYLGFCKGAWKLQNGDKAAFNQCKDWSQSNYSTVHFAICSHTGCKFTGHMDVETIWTRSFTDTRRGLKIRWKFLAMSHVSQPRAAGDALYNFQCLFCAFLGHETPLMKGQSEYLDHVSQAHRGTALGDVILYKTGCVNDRVCDDTEDFVINMFPLTPKELAMQARKESDLRKLSLKKRSTDAKDSLFTASEPWNEGLSDFHYADNFERAHLDNDTMSIRGSWVRKPSLAPRSE